MMRGRQDHGFSVTELMVVLSLIGVLLAAVYFTYSAIGIGNAVAMRQASFAYDINEPLQVMDKALSQNTSLENGGGLVSDGYTITVRGPQDAVTNISKRQVFSAGTDGRLTEHRYEITAGGVVTDKGIREMSALNSNRVKGPMFKYLDSSGNTTTTVGARAVLIEIWVTNEGKSYSAARQVYFRNR